MVVRVSWCIGDHRLAINRLFVGRLVGHVLRVLEQDIGEGGVPIFLLCCGTRVAVLMEGIFLCVKVYLFENHLRIFDTLF